MSGLPHYTNSQAAIQLYEPVYLNQFEVIINTPAGVQQLPGLNGELILTQQVKSVSGMADQLNSSISSLLEDMQGVSLLRLTWI
jgi:hypothetical protein